ncbi:hypothetical protein U7230_07075 [Carboxydochorda subterranea]|uniref:Uncharacterized protein n=1 Tax=Carboxydichorda subterranea TaxID=3109565 RepID=A0ABZ1C0Z5_9FIRM|nr:hypothetical protein [Limnochorda sp. L945t]WRP18747.1 hypothetical protein U7230_07075 [Limnochorda sp. L945t]
MGRRGKLLEQPLREHLFDLIDRGFSEVEVIKALRAEARRMQLPPPDPRTVSRYRLAYEIATGALDPKDPEVKGRLDPLRIKDGFLERVRLLVHHRQTRREAEPAAHPALVPSWRAQHVERLMQLAETIRGFIYNPQIRLHAEVGWDLPRSLEVKGVDLALEPERWLGTVVPDLDIESAWGELWPYLREHLAKSPFWKHLDALRQAVDTYDRALEAAGQKVAEEDPSFRSFWADVTFARQYPVPSRTPVTPDSGSEHPPLYDLDKVEWAVEKLREIAPDLDKHRWDLVRLLEALRDDLLPDRVARLIAESTCSLCRDTPAE